MVALRQGNPVYRELAGLARQIGRPDLTLTLLVMAMSPHTLPSSIAVRSSSFVATTSSREPVLTPANLTGAGLVRRLGRSLAPSLPRLVPRIYVRRFDMARPKVRQAMDR
ncbi:unnamed protein product [Protopolystoma xenopodis]|uniref:Uncharacterized protein n=1 Tax=Protopolystoma xenopodis TaxID=117903 RepID=A0A3S5B5E4_9PLAT|nr:unnamed protein product [Protopolystoma xenopodis]